MDKETHPEEVSLLPLRNTVLFPGVVIPITIGRDKSIKLINDAYKKEKVVGVVAQINEHVEDPGAEDLYKVGTLATILKVLKMPDGNTTVIIQGKKKFVTSTIIQEEPYLKAKINLVIDDPIETTPTLDATVAALKELSTQIINLSPNLPTEANIAIKNIDSPRFLLNFISSNLNVAVAEKQTVLETKNFNTRAELVLGFLSKEHQILELKNQISSKVKIDIDKQQRDYFLQQQMRAIQEELGGDSPDREIHNLRERSQNKKWSAKVEETFFKELNKLERTNTQSPEYSIVLNYLELLLDIPWGHYTDDKLDLKRAQKVLDKDHYGLDKIKDRILEYLAVLKLKGDMKSPILCLYGPPGVGKTSLGKSVAKALGREYIRMSLGGLHDEAEIRGHRKTYIGAMPGRIVQSLKKAGTSNPVFILDEIDKIGNDFRGDPSSAMLEVLDPEQNYAFYDNYLELEVDLSRVMFIATANNLDTIQPALLDRMEIIELNGYLIEEKIQIAKSYLLPKQIEAHGLKKNQLKLSSKAIEKIIDEYTRESGVRSLEKRIATISRHRAKDIVSENDYDIDIKTKDIETILGPLRYEKDNFRDNNIAGIATGLAWTPVGGDVLYIETLLTPGRGRVQLTGKLGTVMKESALTALTYLKSQYKEFGINPKAFETWDVHVHVPEGAVPKDGPSAGITMLTALASAYTQRKIKSDLAMTGEITLRGRVLPVGGIKEKILAAKRLGISEIILCEMNRKDVEDIKPKYVKGLTFHYVSFMQQVIQIALLKQFIDKAINVNKPDFVLDDKAMGDPIIIETAAEVVED
ncbi:MAG: endopeptidase La [Bacteroidota bacterium]|nr:endopeptidase La [Bacteroidota bacterium]